MNFRNGTLEISTKAVLVFGAILIAALLAVMFLAGMLVSGGETTRLSPLDTATPSAMAHSESDDESNGSTVLPMATKVPTPTLRPTPTATPQIVRSKRAYGDCLSLTLHEIELVTRGQFTTWPEYGNRDVAGVVQYRTIDYVANHCRSLAPVPTYSSSTTTSLRCFPDALTSFYRLHVPQGNDNDQYRALAAEYALTVCQPSANR